LKDFVLKVGNLGAGKTVAMVGTALYFAEQSAIQLAELQRQVDAGELAPEKAREESTHLRHCYLNFPLKMGLLKADTQRWADAEEAQGNKYRALAYRLTPDFIHFIGRLDEVPKTPEFEGVVSVSNSLYHFIAQRRQAAEANPLPDRDEGKDYLGIDEAQDLIRSRRSGDRYVKILSENADFFRKMGLEVEYQGPQQSQMDKNFRGKHQVAGDKVLMADGTWKNIEDVKVGDRVVSPNLDGTPSRIATVTGTHSYMPECIYEVRDKLNGKRLYSCSPEHILPITYWRVRRRHRNPWEVESKRVIEDMSAEKAARVCGWKTTNHIHTFSSPLVEFEAPDSSVAPYQLGVWLGDGSCAKTLNGRIQSVVITTQNREIVEPFYESYPGECRAGNGKRVTPARSYYITSRGRFAAGLAHLGLAGKDSGTKFIPDECKRSSSSYRIELLSGLIDTDGFVERGSGRIVYTTKSERLALDVVDVVRSLGGRARLTRTTKGIKSTGFVGHYFNVNIAFTKNPLRLRTWKKERIRDMAWQDSTCVSIKLVKVKPQMVYGIEIDSPSKYYITNDWMVTHNSTKKVLAEKFEYVDPRTGLAIDSENDQHYYFLKFTVFDTSNTERRPSATFFMPYEEAKLVHRYYGTNVFHSQSLTTKNTLSEFTGNSGGAAPPQTDMDFDDESGFNETGGGTANDLLIATAQNVTAISRALNKNPFFNMTPKDAKKLLKWLVKRVNETG
jgi:hypothetical protein